MTLLNNGKKSVGKQSRHIDIRFFCTSDRLKMLNTKVEYCPNEHMLDDFFTKPLQGSLFRDMQDVVMGYQKGNILDKYFYKTKSPSLDHKERVAKNKNHNKKKDTNKMIFADCCKSKKKSNRYKKWRSTFRQLGAKQK